MLILRTADASRRSYNGFQYPESGPVEAPDWDPAPQCGRGLHGLRDGVGDASMLRINDETAVWQVLDAPDDGPCVALGGKVKVPKAVVVYSGDRAGAVAYLDANGCLDKPVVFAVRTSGDRGTSTSGDEGTSTSGDEGTSTSGDEGTSTSGDGGTSTSGHGGTSTSGDRGTSTSGYGGTSTSGYRGTSTSGDRGTSTSGYRGTSTSGHGGTSTSGDEGTSTSGYEGTSTSGEYGALAILWWDRKIGCYRRKVAVVGEGGIEANVPYRLDDDGEFVRADVPVAVAS